MGQEDSSARPDRSSAARVGVRRPRTGDTGAVDLIRSLAGGLAASHAVFGAANLQRPKHVQANWVGRAARKPGAQVIIRSQAARDLALGLGTLAALATHRDDEARRWLAAFVLADATDLAATYAARRRLPRRRARMAMSFAAGSTALAVLGVAGLGRGPA